MLLSLQYLGVVGATLAGVTIVILCFTFKKRRSQRIHWENTSTETDIVHEEIIAVRKKESPSIASLEPSISLNANATPIIKEPVTPKKPALRVLYVLAKDTKVFAGYELLQALLAADFRFGKMNIFHYSDPNTQECLFSLASAMEPGTFDMLNMGALKCPGLTLFMQNRHNDSDETTYQLMLQAAKHLAEDLDGILLDANKHPITSTSHANQEIIA